MKLRHRLLGRALGALGANSRWAAKQALAGRGRYYGDGGTIHSTGHLDVETLHGRVVSVWFRCQLLPFEQHDVDERRAAEMVGAGADITLTGVEVARWN